MRRSQRTIKCNLKQRMGSITANYPAPCDEMLQAHAHAFHQMMNHVGSLALKCALELEIPDLIHAHGRPMTIPRIISGSAIPPAKAPFLRRIMRLLAHMGYFRAHAAGAHEAYSLTPLSEILTRDCPTSLRACMLGCLSLHSATTGHHLSGWLRSDGPAYCVEEFVHGKSLWDMAKENPEFNRMINETMASDSRLVMKAVVEQCKEAFEGIGTIVDVGGGTGTAARTLAEAFPGLKCSVYDLPHVIACVPKSSLVEAVGGNMFEHVPRADAIFLKFILHDWNDDDCVKILKNCREAIPGEGGKVMIVDLVVKDRQNPEEVETQLLWDVAMMVGAGGREREECEWKQMFDVAGFTRYKISQVGLRSLIEVFP